MEVSQMEDKVALKYPKYQLTNIKGGLSTSIAASGVSQSLAFEMPYKAYGDQFTTQMENFDPHEPGLYPIDDSVENEAEENSRPAKI